MSRIYIISDTHFGHKNIIKYENRPFESLSHMDECLIKNWNSVVKKNDIVYHLGDFCFSLNEVQIKSLLSKLNGHKILIIGNHDRNHNSKFWRKVGFDEAYKYSIIYQDFYMLSHKPLYINDHMPYVNVHGHIHSKNYESLQYINVSVEQINYTPILFSDITKMLTFKKENQDRGINEKIEII